MKSEETTQGEAAAIPGSDPLAKWRSKPLERPRMARSVFDGKSAAEKLAFLVEKHGLVVD